jgi:4-amino-4-deoxy-L-arabinose transferase-like glycosyltransferase
MIRTGLPFSPSRSRFQIAYLSLVIAIGFGLRVAELNSLPLSLSLDEAVNGLDALRLLRAGWITPFLQNNFGRETLFFYLQALALQFYGINFFSLRFVSVLTGTLTIPLLYIAGRRLRLENLPASQPVSLKMTSLLAATGLAVSYWHIYFSRVGLRAIILPPLLLGSVWCFWQGWYTLPDSSRPRKSHQRRWLVAAGFLLGLTFYTYLAARLLPLLFITFFATELVINKSGLKERISGFLTFSLAIILAAIPLALYFCQNPHALGSRTQTISIFATGAPLHTLTRNLTALLQIYFLGGAWLGQWPALNVLSALGFLTGLLVCLYRIRQATSRFLLLWWIIGATPTVLTQQNWGATTTILRSIVAWPALFLISAIGLTTLVRLALTRISKLRTPKSAGMHSKWLIASPLFLLLVFGGLVSTYNYFFVWATTYNHKSNDGPVYLARYLNGQTNQISLIPLRFFQESVTSFLLQAAYPNLSNIDINSLHTLLESNPQASPEQVPATYLLPDTSTAESAFVLLVPSVKGQGTAYLLPPLTPPKIKTLSDHTRATAPLSTILNGKREPVAKVYPLVVGAPFLPDEPLPMQPAQVNFNNDVWLTGYHVEPSVAKPGETIALYINWQVKHFIDGDYYLFFHLFDILEAQRRGQSNLPLNSIIQNPHRWSAPLNFIDIYHFRLPSDSLEGIYLFEMGLYHNFSLERLPVIGGEANQLPDDKVILGKFHVQLQPSRPPEYPIRAQFGDSLVLVGGDFPIRTLHPGQTLTYTLHWQALSSIGRDYTVFNHLVDAEGNLRAQQDNMPLMNRYPTSMWDPDEIVMDPYTVPLPSDLEPGPYTLRIGLYEPETGQRLPLKDEAQDFVELPGFITLTQVENAMDRDATSTEIVR